MRDNGNGKSIMGEDYDSLRKKSLNPLRQEFVSIVKAGRKNISEDALTGHMYQAKEAKKIGLIDHIGDKDFAIQRAITLSRKYSRINNAKKALNHVR